ncbi:MAG TPA: hypothetical protein VFZ01_04785 [Geminicoccaceae bacterium]
MSPEDFEKTLDREVPPPDLPPLLRALWLEARGDWEAAHRIAQADEGSDGAWVHAYLHRAEGDLANAGYWYRRAGRPVENGPLEAERRAIAAELLEH